MSIKEAVREIESYVAQYGWDEPVRLFALVKASEVLAEHPDLGEDLPADIPSEAIENPNALLSVEQEELPEASSIEDLLAQIAWPEGVFGAAISLERVTLPPEAEADIPEDPAQAEAFLASDPRREDVRMVIGVTREGDSWCALRLRSHDSADEVLQGEKLVPELVGALFTTFDLEEE